jgi:hypothetical protein
MKNAQLMFITGLLTLVLVANRFAGPSQASKNETNVYKQIKSQMPFPDFAKKEQINGKVSVEFKLNERGSIEILNMNYSHLKLKEYVIEQLSKMHLQMPEKDQGKTYRVAFTFNLIS